MFHVVIYVNPIYWQCQFWSLHSQLGWGFIIGPLMVRCGEQWRGHKFLSFV